MRLIDADALNKELKERVGPPETEDLYAVNLAIIDAPTVEAALVVHSKWKTTDACPHWLYCLNCYKRIVPNVEWIEQYNIPTNYCPNCGAKMDGIEQRQCADQSGAEYADNPTVWA